jgi:hypothetical protein
VVRRTTRGCRSPTAGAVRIPSRVIDELMGHAGGRRDRPGSPMGRVYRETTPAMLVRVTAALDERIDLARRIAADLCERNEEVGGTGLAVTSARA